MAQIDHQPRAARSIDFASAKHPALPVEVVDYRSLVDRVGPSLFTRAQRPSFALAMLIRAGRGSHVVDFETVALVPNRLVVIGPGRVHQWKPAPQLEADLVLVNPARNAPLDSSFDDEATADLDPTSLATANDLIAALGREQERFTPEPHSLRLLGDLASALMHLYGRSTTATVDRPWPSAYLAFRSAIEADLGRSHNARDYVTGLGYSERTVDRACKAATGRTAKGVLDQRLLLEAKRMLAHTDRPLGAIGASLGFGEATNFNKFFARLDGSLPSTFRRDLRDAGLTAGEDAPESTAV